MLGAILSDVRDAVDGYTSNAQVRRALWLELRIRLCEREGDEEDRNEDSSDLGNGVHLENVGKFC